MDKNGLIKDAISRYTENKEKRDRGIIDYIPFYHSLPRFSNYLPGIIRGKYMHFTAHSSVGKTQLAKFLTIMVPYIFSKRVSKLNYKIIYFALEESEEEFVDNLVAVVLNEKYKMNIDAETLNSYKKETISKEIINRIIESEKIVSEILDTVDIVTTESNPTGLYKYCKNISEANGEHKKKIVEYVKSGGEVERREVYDKYVPKNDTQFIVVTDHLGLIGTERGAETTHKAMSKWSQSYARLEITKRWKFSVVDIIQQAAAGEDETFYKGKSIISKLKPSLSGYGDNKIIARDAHIILGLFGPNRFEIEEFNGYNIRKFGDKFRSLEVIKNRGGKSNIEVPLLFEPHKNHFTELPFPGDPLLNNYYN